MKVIISNEIPSIYHVLHDKFGVEWDKGIIITYYPLVHSKFRLHNQKVAHEAVHLTQQQDFGREAWWKKYLEDTDFRLTQEVEAYRQEINYLKSALKDRERRMKVIRGLAGELAGSTYGNICTEAEALSLLLQGY